MKSLASTRSGILIAVAFETSFRAHEFETAVRGLAARGLLVLKDAVTVVATTNGRVKVHESIDPTPRRAAITGALWGSLVGLFTFGPAGWIVGAALGAALAALVAQLVDIGITDAWVAWLTQVARPDTATLALLVDDLHAEALLDEAARFPRARVVSTSLDQHTDARLRAVFAQSSRPPSGAGASPDVDAETRLGGYRSP